MRAAGTTDPDDDANGLGFTTAVLRSFAFLADWGFVIEASSPSFTNFVRDGIVVNVGRDPYGYEIYAGIKDRVHNANRTDVWTARGVLTGEYGELDRPQTREQLASAVEKCASVFREMGRDMLVDRVGLKDFLRRAYELEQGHPPTW